MTIDEMTLNALENIEKGICTNPEAAVSEWIELPDDVDGRSVIALLNQILDPISGKNNGLNLLKKPTHAALVELVNKSPIKELVAHDVANAKMTIKDNLSEEDLKVVRELIRRNRVAFG